MSEDNELIGMFFIGVLLGTFFFFLILVASNTFNPVERLNIDKDRMVSDYVKLNYPEFENCSIKYKTYNNMDCEYSVNGAEVYCNEGLQPRDSLSIIGNNPDSLVCFEDGLTIKDIFKLRLREEGLIDD